MRAASLAGKLGLSLAEVQILTTVRTLERHPQDWQTGLPARPTRSTVERHGELLFGSELEDWSGAFGSLEEGGALELRSDEYRIAPGSVAEAEELRKAVAGEAFGRLQIRADQSPAYRDLCQRVFGLALSQFSLLDREQLDLLLESLDLSSEDHVLDAGCGLGRVTEELQRHTGASFVGVDFSRTVIEGARKRSAGSSRLRFEVADLETLQVCAGTYDGVVSIDTLYFLEDLEGCIRRLRQGLSDGGRMGFLASEIAVDAKAARRLPETSRMAHALREAGMAFEIQDVTNREIEIWAKQRRWAEELLPRFETEGNGDLGAMMLREAERTLEWIDEGRVRRFLYLARAKARRDGSSRG